MTMPNIPNITPIVAISREEALTMLMASIALEEMGLAHIINAEGEKIQYILNSEIHKSAPTGEIKEVNQGVERVIREVMKLQMLLQEKLENVLSLTSKAPDSPGISCPQPSKPKHKPDCTLAGRGEGCVRNESDSFHGGTASVKSSICPVYDDAITFSLKYALCKEKQDRIITALFLAIPESIEVHCPNKLKPCPGAQDPNLLIMQGQGVMAIEDVEQNLTQCAVAFTLTVWDCDHDKKFQMVIYSPNPKFNHDSGVVSALGNLDIV